MLREKRAAYAVIVIQVVLLTVASVVGEELRTVWDMEEGGRFDRTGKGFSMEDGRVFVNVEDAKSLCPNGLRGPAKGTDSLREIVWRYRVRKAGAYWLHVVWDPGGSGKEQFEVVFNGKRVGTSQLKEGTKDPDEEVCEHFRLEHEGDEGEIRVRHVSGDGLIFARILLSEGEKMPMRIKPTLKFPTAASYGKEIGEPAVMIDGDYVRFYAPKRKEREARILHRYLVRAYEELYRIVGVHTKYKIVVYPLPKSNPLCFGGTSECSIWHSDRNLEFDSIDEWTKYHVPHVSGYIEEMAHNFVSASLAQFGWEMTGWSISKIVSEKVAGNPIHLRSLASARKTQAETFARYKQLNNRFPRDIPSNLCDRIHAHLLYQCEREYGPRFWRDFFKEIRNSRTALLAASRSGTGDERRNARYRITIECFDRLMKGRFKSMLKEHGISLTTDIKSLNPNRPDWNRKLL